MFTPNGDSEVAWIVADLRGGVKTKFQCRLIFAEGQCDAGAKMDAQFVGRALPAMSGEARPTIYLHLGQRDANLSLVFAASVLVGGFAHFVALKKQHLRYTFVGVNFCR